MASQVTCINIPSGTKTTGTVSIPAPIISGDILVPDASLSWTRSVDGFSPLSYSLYKKIGAGAYALLADGLTVFEYADSGLALDIVYKYKVQAVDAHGNLSAFSNELTLTQASPP